MYNKNSLDSADLELNETALIGESFRVNKE